MLVTMQFMEDQLFDIGQNVTMLLNQYEGRSVVLSLLNT